MKRVVKIIIALLLVGAISTTTIRNAEAQGAEGVVQVVGGSIAAGGIAAGLAAVAPPALIIVGLIMIGQGIDIALTEASQAEGMTKTEFLQSKFEDFCEYTQKDFERTCNTIVSGAKILADGSMWLADEAGKAISQFINNLVAEGEIVEVISSGDTVGVNGIACPVIYPGESINYGYRNGILQGYRNDSNDYFIIFCVTDNGSVPYIYMAKPTRGNFKISYLQNNVVSSSSDYISQQFYYNGFQNVYYLSAGNLDSYSDVLLPVVGTSQQALKSLIDGFDIEEGGANSDTFVGDVNDIDSSVLNPTSGNDIVIDTGIDINGIASRYGDIGTITIDNYLETLRQAINGVNDLTIAVQNVATGVIENVDVGVFNPTDVAVSNEAEEEAENQIATPVIDVNEYPSGEAAEQALNGLQFDLTKIFPFCIPFDIVHIIQKFDVPRQIPHIQISLPLPGVGETLDLDLDLTPFDGVATVLRTMELIAFVVGLAMVTRSLIRG